MSADSISVGEIFPDQVREDPQMKDLPDEVVQLHKIKAEASEKLRLYETEIRKKLEQHRERAHQLRTQAEIEDDIARMYSDFLRQDLIGQSDTVTY